MASPDPGSLPPADRAFADVVLRRGLASPAAVAAAVEEWRGLVANGHPVAIGQILVRRRAITPQAFQEVHALVLGRPATPPGSGRLPRPTDIPAPPAPAPAGASRFGPYEILGEIARGGMGVVYRARDPRLPREVALKVIRAERQQSGNARERFRREATAAARIDHPNIVKVHEWGTIEGLDYYVMELVRGRSLDAVVADGTLPLERSLPIVRDMARALHIVHEAGIIHRDIKPQNILIDDGGVPRLTDFGLARIAEEEALTRTGVLLGTPLYMAPEQVAGAREIDRRADIFSLGVLFFELLVGSRPFAGSTPMALSRAILEEPAPAPSRVKPGLPPDLDRVVLRALAKDPGDRYPTMEAFADDIDRVLRGERVRSRGGSSVRRAASRIARHRGLITLALVAAAAASFGFLAVLRFGRGAPSTDARVLAERLAAASARIGERVAVVRSLGRANEVLARAPIGLARADAARLIADRGPDTPAPTPAEGAMLSALGGAFLDAGYPVPAAALLDRAASVAADASPERIRARAHAEAGDLDGAVATLRASADPEARLDAADLLLAAGCTSEAEALVVLTARIRPSPRAALLAARCRLLAGDPDGVARSLDTAPLGEDQAGSVAVLRADVLAARGAPEASVLAALREASSRTGDPAVLFAYGRRLAAAGRSDLALPRFEEAAASPDLPPGVRFLLADARIARGDLYGAIRDLEAEAALRPSGEALLRLGDALHAAGRTDEARHTLERALHRGRLEAARGLVALALDREPRDLAEARRLVLRVERAAARNPGAATLAAVLAAEVAAEGGLGAEALVTLRSTGEALDADPAALAWRGRLLAPIDADASRRDLARAAERMGAAGAPGAAAYRTGLAFLGAAGGAGEDAEAARRLAARAAGPLRTATTLQPAWAAAHAALGGALLGTGEVEEAFRELRMAADLDPTDPHPLVAIARHLVMSRGDEASIREAVSLLDRAVAAGAGPDARLLLALALLADGSAERAAREARQAVADLAPTRSSAPRAYRNALATLDMIARGTGSDAAAREAEAAIAEIDRDLDRARTTRARANEMYEAWNPDVARPLAEEALRLDPDLRMAHHLLGKILFRLADVPGAFLNFAAESVANPLYPNDMAWIMEQFAVAQVDQGLLRQGVERFEREGVDEAVRVAMRLLILETRCWPGAGDPATAHERLLLATRLRALAPESLVAWLWDAMALGLLGERDLAADALEVAHDLAGPPIPGATPERPGPYGVRFWAAMVRVRMGTPADLDLACRHLEDALAQGAPPQEGEWALELWRPVADREVFRGRR